MELDRITDAWTVYEDEKGRTHVTRHKIPEPDHYASNGSSQIEAYVTKVVHSTESFSSLIVSTPDGEVALLLLKQDSNLQITLSIDVTSKPDEEQALRRFFACRGIGPIDDYLAQNGDVPDATRMLSFPLPSDIEFVTVLSKELLVQVYGVNERAALDFSFEESTTRPRMSLRSRILGIIFGWFVGGA